MSCYHARSVVANRFLKNHMIQQRRDTFFVQSVSIDQIYMKLKIVRFPDGTQGHYNALLRGLNPHILIVWNSVKHNRNRLFQITL